ncbi:hypothetical protein B0T18DRAFT_487350 [Schizothecium vesticola]|uniref:Uncharacterized protein n=1 Tax=Schizothecium vesticola TaxID=314040 RepID=A0AA40K819_9PEZI|nr:hypothetical protein B0T18DRAFT_487350 [Schizothecium vesticola]
MFGSRKHRQPNPPLATAPVDPNAATAAAAVFRRHETSSPSLSAAAAATALARRPMTPTRVADVQTKRTIRRSASVASSAASSDAHSRPALQRSGSSASMTERTFRSPSPHRPSSSGSGHRQTQSLGYGPTDDMPPVPALPTAMDSGSRHQQQGNQQDPPQRRATALGISNPPVRLASEALASKDAQSWFGAAKVGDMRNVRRTDPAMASPPSSPPRTVPQEQSGAGRPSSRSSSINFSYPARARVASPPPGAPFDDAHLTEPPPVSASQQRRTSVDRQPSQSQQSKSQPKRRVSAAPGSASGASSEVMIYDPNSRRMVRQADLWAAEQTIVQASERHTSMKRKKQTPERAGSHLAKGTMGRTKVGGSVVLPDQQPPTTSTAPPTKPQLQTQQALAADAQIARTSSPKPEPRAMNPPLPQEPTVSQIDGSDAADRIAQDLSVAPTPRNSTGQLLKRQPSTVKEESEQGPELEDDYVLGSLDAVPARQRLFINGASQPDEVLQTSNHPPNIPAAPLSPPPSQEPQFSADPPKPVGPADTDNSKYAGFAPIKNLHIIPPRNHSNSPVRQAHFGPVSDSLAVKHSPPPRSISPRKSALKNSCSPTRGASPSDDTSEASGGVPHHQDPTINRKKAVRVSFDDANTVVAVEQADSQSPSSPQGHQERRPWYSSLRPGKKEHSSLDDDEIMKPRPALPSFGSVRDRKPREVSQDEAERPLVRPIVDRSHAPPEQLGQSSDHALAAILAKDSEDKARVPANTSRFREPLPPVVTSVDGGDFLGESDASSTADSDDLLASEGTDVHGEKSLEVPSQPADEVPRGQTEPVKVEPLPRIEEAQEKQVQASSSPLENTIPTITIAQPTPPAVEKNTLVPYLNLPGGFPDDDSSSTASIHANNFISHPEGIKEPVAAPLGVIAGQPALLAAAESSSDSESSIYSDAYEDLSDIEGGTFQSLDAVVESPTSIKPTRDPFHDEAPFLSSPSRQPPPEPENTLPSTSVAFEQPAPADDEWDKVKAFWRSLTAEKRAQLAKETTEDAGIDGDLEEIMTEAKPKKKKTVERRASERKVLAVHMAQQMMAQKEKQKPMTTGSNRSYMIQPGTKWAEDKAAASTMRTTMRSQPPRESPVASHHDGPRLRTSMRSSEPSAAKSKSSRQPQLQGQGSQAPRTGSEPMAATKSRGTTTHMRAASEQISPAGPSSSKVPYNPPKLKRRGSTSSESSFRRSRPVGGGLSAFRQSMRQASPTAQPTAQPTVQPTSQPEKSFKRFSLRSRSPPVSMNNASSQMRQTLRDSSSERKKSSPSGGFRMPSFGLSQGANSKKAEQRASSTKVTSRFGDSSDEEGGGGKSGFRSRFEESSDDEPLSPISPPKRSPTILAHLRHQESLASTALPEELEESEELPVNDRQATDDAQKFAAAPALPAGQQPATANTPATPPAGPAATQLAPVLGITTMVKGTERHPSTPSKRHSIMSALRRKKQHGISRPEITESAARRDTKLERPVSQLRRIRTSDAAAAPLADHAEAESDDDDENPRPLPRSPRSPKLQKRVASLRRSMDSANPSVNVTGGDVPSPLALPGSMVGEIDVKKRQGDPSPFFAAAGGGAGAGGGGGGGGTEDQALRSPLRRPSAGMSGNLGTRTLSGFSVSKTTSGGGGGGGGGGVFAPRRTVSSGVVGEPALALAPEASSLAGTGSTKKKKFSMLRRLLGIHD